jgi:hypothetical protein
VEHRYNYAGHIFAALLSACELSMLHYILDVCMHVKAIMRIHPLDTTHSGVIQERTAKLMPWITDMCILQCAVPTMCNEFEELDRQSDIEVMEGPEDMFVTTVGYIVRNLTEGTRSMHASTLRICNDGSSIQIDYVPISMDL